MTDIYNFVSGPLVWISFIIFFGGSFYRLIKLILLTKKKENFIILCKYVYVNLTLYAYMHIYTTYLSSVYLELFKIHVLLVQ